MALFPGAEFQHILNINNNIDTLEILRFIQLLCDHLDKRFPDQDVEDWNSLDLCVMKNNLNIELAKIIYNVYV